jgi:hypothetical protein
LGVLRKSRSLVRGNNKIAPGNGRSGKCVPLQKLIRGAQLTLIFFCTKRSVYLMDLDTLHGMMSLPGMTIK